MATSEPWALLIVPEGLLKLGREGTGMSDWVNPAESLRLSQVLQGKEGRCHLDLHWGADGTLQAIASDPLLWNPPTKKLPQVDA